MTSPATHTTRTDHPANRGTVEVPAHIVTCAVRYALGRRSYVVGDVCDLVTRVADDLGDQRAVIAQDVYRHLRDQAHGIVARDHDQDRARWEQLYAHLVGPGDGAGR